MAKIHTFSYIFPIEKITLELDCQILFCHEIWRAWVRQGFIWNCLITRRISISRTNIPFSYYVPTPSLTFKLSRSSFHSLQARLLQSFISKRREEFQVNLKLYLKYIKWSSLACTWSQESLLEMLNFTASYPSLSTLLVHSVMSLPIYFQFWTLILWKNRSN